MSFFTKGNKHLLEKWLAVELEQGNYKMILEHVLVLAGKEVQKDDGAGQKDTVACFKWLLYAEYRNTRAPK